MAIHPRQAETYRILKLNNEDDLTSIKMAHSGTDKRRSQK